MDCTLVCQDNLIQIPSSRNFMKIWSTNRKSLLSYNTKSTSNKRKRKIDKLCFIKIKIYALQRTPSIKLKDNSQNGTKYLQIMYMTRDLHLEYVKNSHNSIVKRWKGWSIWIDISQRRYTNGQESRPFKRQLMSLTIRKVQIKTIMRYHFASTRMSITKKTDNNKCWRDYGEIGILINFW